MRRGRPAAGIRAFSTIARRLHTLFAGRISIGAAVVVVWILLRHGAVFPAQEVKQGQPALAWEQLPPLPDAHGFAGAFAGVSGDALLVGGGTNFGGGRPWDGSPKLWSDRVFVLTAPDAQWREAGRLPRPLGYGVSVTAAEGMVCLGGGNQERHSAEVFVLKWKDGKLETAPLPPMPGPAAFSCGAILNNTIYVAGGLAAPDSSATLKTFWALDLAKPDSERTWRQLEAWPGRPRMLAVAGAQDGSFFLFSGVDLAAGKDGKPQRVYLTDAYRFTPGRGWKRIADAPRPVAAAPSPAPALGQSHLMLLGGDSGELATRTNELKDQHPGFSRDILAYHTITNTWTKMGELIQERSPDAAANQAGAVPPPVTTVAAWWRESVVVPSGEIRPGVRAPQVLRGRPIQRTGGFDALDYVVLLVYLAAMAAMGPYFAGREKSTKDFFLAGKRIPWWAAGLSIFGTQLSAITFMAIPAMTYRTDWVYFLGNMMIVAAAPLVAFVYVPFYRRLDVTTAYEYLEKRFNLAARLLGSLAFILFQLGRMGVVIYLPALAFATITGVNIYFSILAMGVVTTLYTLLGGVEAVTWTDVVQVVVLLGAALVSLILTVAGAEGGWTRAVSMAWTEGKFHGANWGWDILTTALWVVIVGKFLEQLVPYTADQAVVQRYLTTPTEKQAVQSIWTNAVLTIPSSLIFFAIGTGLWTFYRANPQLLNPVSRTDDIFPWFIAQQLPAGVSGLAVAGLFAAAMSTLSGSINSVATAITTDFFRRLRPAVTDRQCLNFARMLTVLLGLAGTLAAVYMAILRQVSMWDQFIKLLGLFGGGLAGLFVAGIFTRRTSGTGAVAGFFASALVLYLVSSRGLVHFFLYTAIGVVSCVGFGWAVSCVLGREKKDLRGLTIHTILEAGKKGEGEAE